MLLPSTSRGVYRAMLGSTPVKHSTPYREPSCGCGERSNRTSPIRRAVGNSFGLDHVLERASQRHRTARTAAIVGLAVAATISGLLSLTYGLPVFLAATGIGSALALATTLATRRMRRVVEDDSQVCDTMGGE